MQDRFRSLREVEELVEDGNGTFIVAEDENGTIVASGFVKMVKV
jgi:hypothetical protein